MASSNPTSWSLLPLELLENILLRIPVESLARFKSTCKEWRDLLDDKRFIYKHLELSREGLIRVHDPKSFQFIDLETLALSSLQGRPSKIDSMIHCDGLLLCVIGRKNNEPIKERKLAVWNPFLGQFKRIKPASSSSYTWFDIYGFGYDNASRDNYKILRFKSEKGCEEVEIYEFKSQLWRSVDYSLAYSWCSWRDQAISMKGNMYWIAEKEGNDDDNSKTYFIQSFDFSKEVFKETCCIPFLNHNDWPPPPGSGLSPRLSGFGGDRLSLLAQRRSGEIEVWVTNSIVTDDDELVSWSMYCNVTPDFRILALHPTYLIHHTGRVKLWFDHTDVGVKLWCSEKDERIYASVYEIGEGEVKKQVETGQHGRYERICVSKFSSTFVPSLLPVPKQEETSDGCSC